MKITSGSWRATDRSAVEKSGVDPDLALVDDREVVRCRISIGSSTVTMWPVVWR
jgi:hypothetical protein